MKTNENFINFLYTIYEFFSMAPTFNLDFWTQTGSWYSFCFMPELIASISIILILSFSLLTKRNWHIAAYANMIFSWLIITLMIMLFLIMSNEMWWHLNVTNAPFYSSNRFISIPILTLLKIVLIIFTIILVLLHKRFFVKVSETIEYSIIILTLTISMLLIISCNDLFLAFLSLELQAITLYVFLGLKKFSNLAMESAIKFFIYSAFSSVCFIFGVSLLYATTGTTSFIFLNNFLFNNDNYIIILACMLIIFGLLFKLTLGPFYLWVGDIFQGSFAYVASYFAIVTKLPILVLISKIIYIAFLPISDILISALKLVVIVSIILSSIYALTELNFRRFWAISSITNISYILLAILMGGVIGHTIAFFYIIIYMICTTYIWCIVIFLYKNVINDLTIYEFIINLIKFINLHATRYLIALSNAWILFSLSGLPPGPGFLPKLMIFFSLYMQNDLFIFAIIFACNLISSAYYLRLSRFFLFDTYLSNKSIDTFKSIPSDIAYVIAFLFMLNMITFFIYLELIYILPLFIYV